MRGASKAMPPTSEHLRISTITAQGRIGKDGITVDFAQLFMFVPLVDAPCHLGFQMVKYRDPFGCCHQRGEHPKHRNAKSKKKLTEALRNQITVVQWLHDPSISQLHHVSVKIFANGRVHLAGLRDAEMGPTVIASIASAIWTSAKAAQIASPPSMLHIARAAASEHFSLIMINSDFKVPFYLSCARLSAVARENGLMCQYEQDNNAGVKLILPCAAAEDVPEKNITVIVCRTGSVIITGANDMRHVPLVHRFVRDFLFDHRSDVEIKSTPTIAIAPLMADRVNVVV
jgi:hypothetical protein